MSLNRYERACLMASNIYAKRITTIEVSFGVKGNKTNLKMIMKESIDEAIMLSNLVKEKCEEMRKEKK